MGRAPCRERAAGDLSASLIPPASAFDKNSGRPEHRRRADDCAPRIAVAARAGRSARVLTSCSATAMRVSQSATAGEPFDKLRVRRRERGHGWRNRGRRTGSERPARGTGSPFAARHSLRAASSIGAPAPAARTAGAPFDSLRSFRAARTSACDRRWCSGVWSWRLKRRRPDQPAAVPADASTGMRRRDAPAGAHGTERPVVSLTGRPAPHVARSGSRFVRAPAPVARSAGAPFDSLRSLRAARTSAVRPPLVCRSVVFEAETAASRFGSSPFLQTRREVDGAALLQMRRLEHSAAAHLQRARQ